MTTTIMPFGKHKGRALADVPMHYLEWLQASGELYDPLKSAITAELARRSPEPAPTRGPRVRAIGGGSRSVDTARVTPQAHQAAVALLAASRGQLVLALQALVAVVTEPQDVEAQR